MITLIFLKDSFDDLNVDITTFDDLNVNNKIKVCDVFYVHDGQRKTEK